MPKAHVNRIQLEYETFGNPAAKPLLLIMGLGAQLIAWPEAFCQQLVNRGFYVIRFDNRDVGLSTKFDEVGVPDVVAVITTLQEGEGVDTPYSLEDMADDAVGLLDALHVRRANICGASMGAYIAQIIAFRHPTRVLSLTSIMGTTGPNLPPRTPEAMRALEASARAYTHPPPSRETYITTRVQFMKALYGSGFPFNETRARGQVAASYDRCYYPPGEARQLVASRASSDRTPRLASIKVPTLVIHGSEDPRVPVEGGRDTAAAISGATLMIIEGMGHSLPPETWPQIVNAITENTEKALHC